MMWFFLSTAIVAEVGGTMSLRATLTGSRLWYLLVAAGYLLAFMMLSMALSAGMGIGVAYGIWAAAGVAITAVLSKWIFKEPLTLLMTAGILLIVGGVLLVELGAGA